MGSKRIEKHKISIFIFSKCSPKLNNKKNISRNKSAYRRSKSKGNWRSGVKKRKQKGFKNYKGKKVRNIKFYKIQVLRKNFILTKIRRQIAKMKISLLLNVIQKNKFSRSLIIKSKGRTFQEKDLLERFICTL